MRRTRLALGMLFALAHPEAGGAAAPARGVFATINGKRLKAVSTGQADDPCIIGFYQATGGVVFTASECRGRRRRRVPRRNSQQVIFICGVIDPPKTPPYEASCLAATYSEVRTRRRVPFEQKIWNGSNSFELGPDGMIVQHPSVRLFVDAFDGANVRGRFSGVYDQPQQAGAPTSVAIGGEGTFDFPVRGVQ